MSAFEPFAITEQHLGVRIEPLTLAHSELYRAALLPDPDTMQHFTEMPDSFDLPDIEAYIRIRTRPGFIAQAIFADGRFAGSSSYYDIRSDHHGLEIGHTWYSPDYRGTRLNPIVKLLMIRAAIEQFNAMRVQLKTGSANMRSQKAMRNIGLTEEGVLRNHLRLPSGKWRDSVMFSVTPDTWPVVEARLQELIGSRPNWRAVPDSP